LGNDGENLGTTLLEHVKDTLHGKEAVGVLLFADTLEEDGQVMMVIELHNIDLPLNFVLRAMLNRNGQVSAVVEAAELRGDNRATVDGTSDGLHGSGLFLGGKEGAGLATNALALFEGSLASSSDGCLACVNNGNGLESGSGLGHVAIGVVTEARVLGLGQELVEASLPGLAIGDAEDLLEVILGDHLRSVVDLRHRDRLYT